MNRKWLWAAVLAIGLALVIVPFAISMPSKAAAGQDMLNGFRPIMQADQVQKTAMYYNDVFVPLGKVIPIFGQMPPNMQTAFAAAVQQTGVDPRVFQLVPAGLVHYKPLVTTMQANIDNFAQVDSLPSFDYFTWFFVIPGAVLVLLAGLGFYAEGSRVHRPHHRATATPAH